jgi:hypothetical protein
MSLQERLVTNGTYYVSMVSGHNSGEPLSLRQLKHLLQSCDDGEIARVRGYWESPKWYRVLSFSSFLWKDEVILRPTAIIPREVWDAQACNMFARDILHASRKGYLFEPLPTRGWRDMFDHLNGVTVTSSNLITMRRV